MPARYMRWLLTAALVLTAAQFVVAGVFVVGAPLVDQPLTTRLNVIGDHGRELVVPMTGEGTGKAVIHSGELVLDLNDWRAVVLKVADVGVTGGLAITVLLMLWRFVGEVRDGRPFTPRGAARLRTLGVLVLAMPAWQVIDAALWQGLLLTLMADGGAVVSTFATARVGHENLRLMPDINLGLVFAGLILMVIGEAFLTGAMLQRDSDEIV